MVGLGKMGLSHLAIVRAHPQVELIAGCDSSGYLTDVLSQDQRDRLKTIQKRVVDAYRSPIVAAIADGRIAPVDATVAAFNALAIVQYTAVWFRRGRRHKVADIADEQARAVLLMLGASLPATLARQVG